MQQEDRKALGLQYLGKIGKIQAVRDIKEFQTSLNSLVGVPAKLPLTELGTCLQEREHVDVRNLKRQTLLRWSCCKMLELGGKWGLERVTLIKRTSQFTKQSTLFQFKQSQDFRVEVLE